eukprot:1303868-Ditylum_brightwellii.AAC.1
MVVISEEADGVGSRSDKIRKAKLLLSLYLLPHLLPIGSGKNATCLGKSAREKAILTGYKCFKRAHHEDTALAFVHL